MALQQLLGPISTTRDPDDAQLTGAAGFKDWRTTLWHDDYGLVSRASDGAATGSGFTGVLICNLDGVCYLRKYKASSSTVEDYEWHYDDLTNLLLTWGSATAATDPHNIKPLTGEVTDSINTLNYTVRGPRMKNAWYTVDSGAPTNELWSAPLHATNISEYSREYTFSPAISVSTGHSLFLGPNGIMFYWLGDSAGTIVQYDVGNQTEVFPDSSNTNRLTLGRQVARCFYSRKYDIFITVEANAIDSDITDIYVYANELAPSALAAPSAVTAVTQGRVSTIKTTLTDSNGVGVPDRRIDWSITAGNGALSATQSTTNSTGVAEIQYRALTSGGSNPTILASLTY